MSSSLDGFVMFNRPPPPRRSWFYRHRKGLGVAGLVLAVVVGKSIGDPMPTASAAKTAPVVYQRPAPEPVVAESEHEQFVRGMVWVRIYKDCGNYVPPALYGVTTMMMATTDPKLVGKIVDEVKHQMAGIRRSRDVMCLAAKGMVEPRLQAMLAEIGPTLAEKLGQ